MLASYVTRKQREIFKSLNDEQVLGIFELVSKDKDKDEESMRRYWKWQEEVLRRMNRK